MKFKWWRFGTYLTIGLLCFGTWVSYNYNTYVVNGQVAQMEIEENYQIIEETQEELSLEQHDLRMVQEIMSPQSATAEPSRRLSRAPSALSAPSGSFAASRPTPPSSDPMRDELQARIDRLEDEKEALEREKHYIKQAILDSVSVFKGIKVDNPLVNAIIIPIFLYIMKKLIDMLFRRLEEKHEEANAI